MGTTVSSLLDRVRVILADSPPSPEIVTREQWETFDHTLYRLMHELVRSRVGWSTTDPHAAALRRAFQDYPQPLRPADDQPDFSLRETARFLGITETAARQRVFDGTLLAAHTFAGYRIPRCEVTEHRAIRPASSDDPRLLARLACTFGAITDVLIVNRMDPAVPELQAASATTIATDCLAIAGTVAARTISSCDLSIVERPLALAKYTADTQSRLPASQTLQGMQDPLLPPADRPPLSATDALEAAIYQWTRAARAELSGPVPSVAVLKDVNHQGIHIYASLDAIIASAGAELDDDLRVQLRTSAMALQRAADAWSQTTTGAPPSRVYVEWARRLYSALAPVTSSTRDLSGDEITYQAMLRGACNLATVAPLATSWVARLLESETLFMHARHAAPNARRLTAKLAGRMAVATQADVPTLAAATWEAQCMTAEVARRLPATSLGRIEVRQRGCHAEL